MAHEESKGEGGEMTLTTDEKVTLLVARANQFSGWLKNNGYQDILANLPDIAEWLARLEEIRASIDADINKEKAAA